MANLTENFGGAVPPLAFALTLREMGRGKTLPIDSARPVQLTCRKRLSRLCVLMNPCPAGPEFHSALAGYRVFPKPMVLNHDREKRRDCFKLKLLRAGHLRGDTRDTLVNSASGPLVHDA